MGSLILIARWNNVIIISTLSQKSPKVLGKWFIYGFGKTSQKIRLVLPGLEPGTFRVLSERDNHYTTELLTTGSNVQTINA